MWFKSKSKEKKEQELQAELIQLRLKYADEIDSYCKIDDFIFILKGFKIENNKIYVHFVYKDTVKDYINYLELYWFGMKYGTNFKKARYQFIKFKEDLKKIGLKLEKIKEL
jgi:hypothetical protein